MKEKEDERGRTRTLSGEPPTSWFMNFCVLRSSSLRCFCNPSSLASRSSSFRAVMSREMQMILPPAARALTSSSALWPSRVCVRSLNVACLETASWAQASVTRWASACPAARSSNPSEPSSSVGRRPSVDNTAALTVSNLPSSECMLMISAQPSRMHCSCFAFASASRRRRLFVSPFR